MMAGLFVIYLFSLLLLLGRQKNFAFILITINVILSLLMLLHHATDIVNIRL